MNNSDYASKQKYFRRVIKLIFLTTITLFITALSPTSIYSLNFSYGQEDAGVSNSGHVKVFVVHMDNHEVDPAHFLSAEANTQGYFSIYEEDGNFLEDAASCNLDSSCELALPIGLYEASVVNPNSLTPYSVPFEVVANVTVQPSIQMDQGSFKITVLEGISDNDLADTSTFGHPGAYTYGKTGGYAEEGWFAMYYSNRDFILDSVTCNYDGECTYPYDSGTYTILIKRMADNQIMACAFSITDNNLTPIEYYLDTGGCNYSPSNPASPSDDGGSDGSNNNTSGDNNTNNNTNSDSGTNDSPSVPISKREPIRLLNYTNYIDPDSGFYHVVGEIQNLGTNPAHEITIHGIFYEGDEIVAVKQGFSLQSVLAPGGISPFEIEIKSTSISPSITNYTLTIPTSERTTEVKQQNLGLNITRQYYDTETRLYHLEGIVVNYGSAVASFVRVIATAYDQESRPIYVTSKYTNSHLDNGNPATFEIVFAPNYDVQIARVSAIVESDEYSMVKEGFLKSPITVTLDSSAYDNGMFVEISGTVGSFLTTEPYAFVKILWPDGIQEDSDLVKVSPDGSYNVKMQFFSQPEYFGETFTVRTSYGVHYADKHFVFAQSCIPSDLWGMIVTSALDDTNDRAQIEQCLSSLAVEGHDPRIVTPSSPLRVEASNMTGARVEFSVTLAANGTSGFGQPLCIPRSGSVFPVGNTTISCITGDRQGNSAVATFIIYVQDNSPPQMVPPPDVTIELLPNANGTVAASELSLGIPLVSDLVDPSPTVFNNATEAFPTGKTIVLWTSTDASGNTAMVNQTVIVIAIPEESEGSVQIAANRDSLDNYETKYSSQAPDENNPLVFQPEYRLYRPAENVVIFGLVHESLLSTFVDGIASVNFKLVDEKGSQVGEPVTVIIDPITGAFSSTGILLPQQLSPGVYKLQSEVKVDLEKARTLLYDDSQLQKLESLGELNSLQDLIVGGSDTYLVSEEGLQFQVHIASNAHLCCNRYSNNERKIAFESIIANSSSVNTVAEVAVPKFLLDGQISVFIDGQAVSDESVVLKDTDKAGNSSMTILEVNYGPGAHTVEIYGTNVVPEFPLISYLLPAVAIIVILSGMLLRKTRFHDFG